MLKYYKVIVLSLILINIAQARLTINITKGISQKIPIAVLPFSGKAVKNDQVPEGISSVISEDLKNSGYFDVTQSRFPESLKNTSKINWQKWSENYIVTGEIKESLSGDYDVQYELVGKLNNKLLSARRYSNIKPEQFRTLSHTIANEIYHQITDNKGYFTSKLAYIDVQNPYRPAIAVYQLVIADYDGFNPHVLLQQTKEPVMSPTWSKDGQYIAYVSYDKGSMAIYTINVYSGVRKKIANYKGINSAPAFSPNGHTMAMALSQGYSENTNIFLMNLNSDKLYKKLSLNGINTAPTFSPSGKEIAFVSNRSGSPQIYITPIDSKYPESKRITFKPKQAFDPQYTPNGENIVFMYQGYNTKGTQIAKINLRTKHITVLTSGKMDSSPSVSPDGNMIIYSQEQESGNAQLAMVSIDGKVHITLPSNTKGAVQSPSWSPTI